MATMLDTLLATGVGAGPAPSSDMEDHASHAAAPQAHLSGGLHSAETIAIALGGFVLVIYGLHIAERVVRRK